MNKENEAKSDTRYSKVPADFPRPDHLGAVAGAQPKLLLTGYQGRFYAPGCTPPKVWQRWDICEDLAQQLYRKSLESKAGKRAHMSETAILEQRRATMVSSWAPSRLASAANNVAFTP
jgi:hypothetical protein